MGLTSSLYLGNSALTAAQLAIQVTGNNLANAATPGYSRQIATLSPLRSSLSGRISVGTGVQVSDVRRQVDEALQARLWGGMSQHGAAEQQHAVLSQIESILGELGENDLSSELSKFFNSWSERANLSLSSAVVVQQGQRIADYVRRLRSDLSDQRSQMDRQLGLQAGEANGILTQIAELNRHIASAQSAGGSAGTLLDQRDELIGRLSEYMDVSAIEQTNGSMDILVGSTPVVMGGTSRGIELRRESENGAISVSLNVVEDGQRLTVSSGVLGAALAERDGAVTDAIERLDRVASQLIFQTNRLHALSTNAGRLTSTSAWRSVAGPDRALALNDPANTTFADLPFAAKNGGFEIQVSSPTGDTQTVWIPVDLDGRNALGDPGFEDDTTAEDLAAAIDAVGGVSATLGADGRLRIEADAGYSFAFTKDTSDVLAVLGVNSYFTGSDGSDINVRTDLKENPNLLGVGKIVDGVFVENGTALAIAGLQDAPVEALGGRSISQNWIEAAQSFGVRTDAARNQAQAAGIVRASLENQRASVSGVSVDEESINLLTYQRQYQGAARFITVVDELTQTLLALV